jgi:amidase
MSRAFLIALTQGASLASSLTMNCTSSGFSSGFMRPLIRDRYYRMGLKRITTSAQDSFKLLMERDRLVGKLERFLERYEAWLCPVAADSAFPHRRPYRPELPIDVDGRKVSGVLATMAHTCPFNLTGHPVVGLPIGVQVVGRRWGEMALLRVAEALEKTAGPFRSPPE